MAPDAAGYSGTPLAKKLGIKAGHRVAVLDGPVDFADLLLDLPTDVTFATTLRGKPDVVIAFQTQHKIIEKRIDKIAAAIFPDAMVWFAWPKKTSGVDTDLTGDVVRATVLSTQLVDVKVCAISDVWSGLKCVWRKAHRQ